MHSQTAVSKFAPRILIGLLMVTLSAGAQTQPLAGWTMQPTPGGLLLSSPAPWNSPSVMLGLLMPTFIAEPPESWFTNQTIVRSQAGGVPLAATGIMRNGPMLVRVVKIQGQGQIMRDAFYTYQAAGQQQMAILFVPEGVDDNDPRVQAAVSYVQALAARQIDLGSVLASVSSGPQYGSPGSARQSPAGGSASGYYNQTDSLRRFSTTMSNSTIDLMHAMSH